MTDSAAPAPDQEILAMARRETCVEYCREFEPIVRGPLFAVVALILLCGTAVPVMVWRLGTRAVARLFSRGE
jgi:hypothetical protein